MILTDREIRVALQENQVTMDPLPNLTEAISSTAIDLTLADTFKEWSAVKGMSIRPGAEGYSYTDFVKLQVEKKGPYTLKPQHFVLAWTAEK